jgi:two-component system NtrC family sensor kinase
LRPVKSLGSGSVLVVDDEELVRRSVKRVLETLGYTVILAANGKEALERAEENFYAVVISDYQMPRMNGMALFQQLSEKYPDVGQRFIFISGELPADVARWARAAGVPCLPKPFSLSELRATVFSIMERLNLG